MLSYQFQKALWCGVVVSSFIGKVEFAHVVDTAMSKGHEFADGGVERRLKRNNISVIINSIF